MAGLTVMEVLSRIVFAAIVEREVEMVAVTVVRVFEALPSAKTK